MPEPTHPPLLDLLGHPITPSRITLNGGYADEPGTGPQGKTCRDCQHYRSVQGGAQSWPKCGLMRDHWTRGKGTDIKAGSPACRAFEPKPTPSDDKPTVYIYAWGNNEKRRALKGRPCIVEARGSMGSVCIRLLDDQTREIVSARALRRARC